MRSTTLTATFSWILFFQLLVLFPSHIAGFSTASVPAAETPTTTPARPEQCYYRNSATNNMWRPRVELEHLQVGQELQGVVVQEYLDGKKGPKVFIDCGVCRPLATNWKMVNAMLRLPCYKKSSVLRKKVLRLRKKSALTVYVSRILLAEGRLEVVLEETEIPQSNTTKPLQSTSTLEAGARVHGRVVRWNDYGVIVRIPGYNRSGLLHIQRVADAYGRYIDRKAGLRATLPQSIPCVVVSNDKRRLFLDLDEEFKARLNSNGEGGSPESSTLEEEEDARIVAVDPDLDRSTITDQDTSVETETSSLDVDDEDDAYEEADYDEYYEGDDDYFEDQDIEDQFGLGMY